MCNSHLKRSGMARVDEASHSFTCHPHAYPQESIWHCDSVGGLGEHV